MATRFFPTWLAAPVLAAAALAPRAEAQVFADFQTTMGAFTVELFHEDVPRTVANFVSLAEGTRPWVDPLTQRARTGVPFYDGIIFHRVIPEFMIQAGSPQGNGSDGPGYKFPDEFTKSPTGQLLHTHNAAGRLSMANSGPHSNGSQFFITTSVTPPRPFPVHLDDMHTVFGQISDGPAGAAAQGQAVVDAISAVPATPELPPPAPPANKPLADVVIQSVRVRRVGASAMAFDPLAWNLPDVAGARTIIDTAYLPGATPPASARFSITYEARRHQATAFNISFDAVQWSLLGVGGAPSTVISRSDSIDPLNISGVGSVPELLVRGRSIDYAPLVARTKPDISESADIRLLFTVPDGQELIVSRTGASTGAWSKPGPPEATGAVSSLNYAFGNGDAGLFSPVLDLGVSEDPVPWTGGSSLSALNLELTFNANDPAAGYFNGFVVNAANSGAASVKGVFTVTSP